MNTDFLCCIKVVLFQSSQFRFLAVSSSACVFPTVFRRALVVLINTVTSLETLYTCGIVHVSVLVRVGSVSRSYRPSSMAPWWLFKVLPRLASPLRCSLSHYLRKKVMVFLFGVAPLFLIDVLPLSTPEVGIFHLRLLFFGSQSFKCLTVLECSR